MCAEDKVIWSERLTGVHPLRHMVLDLEILYRSYTISIPVIYGWGTYHSNIISASRFAASLFPLASKCCSANTYEWSEHQLVSIAPEGV
jgi:hypothetical protein